MKKPTYDLVVEYVIELVKMAHDPNYIMDKDIIKKVLDKNEPTAFTAIRDALKELAVAITHGRTALINERNDVIREMEDLTERHNAHFITIKELELELKINKRLIKDIINELMGGYQS